MIAQIDHASGVVRRMRDFLRRGRPHVSTIDIRNMLEEALILVRAEAAANQVRIDLDASKDLPAIHGDRTQLEQVVLNLIRNAIESIAGARKADGRIGIAAYRLDAPPHVEIGVSDNGPGVDRELADRLFEPLATSKEAGLGLGLPICLSIVESHGGPLLLPSPEAGATGVPVFAAARSIASHVTMPGPTIFVIDDQESVRHALGEMLSVFGFTVETYDSADAFLQAIDRLPSGCVVADVRMPGTDGIELVRELSRRKVALPVVLISGHADVPMAVAGIKSGAEDFIEKPVDDAQLVAAINRAFARTFERQH